MTREEFSKIGLGQTTGIVAIQLKKNAGTIYPARLQKPALYENAPKKIYQSPESTLPQQYTKGTPLHLLYEVYIGEEIHSPTSWTPAGWRKDSVPLESVESIKPMP